MGTLPEIRQFPHQLPDDVDFHGRGDSDYLQIRDYTRILYRRRWLIIGIVVAGLSTGAVIDSTTEQVFEGRATLQLDTDVNVLGVDRPLMPIDQRDWMREFVPTQLGVLQSRELARIVHEEFKGQEPSGENGASQGGDAHAIQAPAEGVHKRVPTVAEIIDGRSVNLVRDSRLVNIGFRSTEPELAASVPNALARAYVQQNRLFRAKTTGDASEWLEQQVAIQRKLVAETGTHCSATERCIRPTHCSQTS